LINIKIRHSILRRKSIKPIWWLELAVQFMTPWPVGARVLFLIAAIIMAIKVTGTYTRIYSVRLWKLIVPAVTEVNIFRKMNWSMSFGNTIRKTEHGCGPLPGSNWMLQRQPTLYWMP